MRVSISCSRMLRKALERSGRESNPVPMHCESGALPLNHSASPHKSCSVCDLSYSFIQSRFGWRPPFSKLHSHRSLSTELISEGFKSTIQYLKKQTSIRKRRLTSVYLIFVFQTESARTAAGGATNHWLSKSVDLLPLPVCPSGTSFNTRGTNNRWWAFSL